MKKNIFGSLIMMEGGFLFLSFLLSMFYYYTAGESDWQSLLIPAVISMLLGGVLKYMGRHSGNEVMTRADSFLIVSLTWVIFSFIGMLPFLLYEGLDIDIASAFFETMSGFSTTGATVLTNIDDLPHGILFWRSITQWMGGLGIVVFSFALLPVSDLKNSNIFSAEVTGISVDKLRPKIADTARRLLLIYLFLTLLCAFMYWLGPMNMYDSICHAMTTIATGGYGTHQASIGYFHSAYIEYVASVFMLISSINFSLYYYFTIRRPSVLFRNEEMHWFLMIVLMMVAVFCLLFRFSPDVLDGISDAFPDGGEQMFRTSLFHVITTISSSGFQGEYYDYVNWGPSFWMPTVLIMAIGSCGGSTAGGIKIVRIIIYIKCTLQEFILQLHPRAVRNVRLGGQIVPDIRVRRSLAFIIGYTILSVLGIVAFTLMGIDVDSAIGACISSLSNVGPGTGQFGPAGTFAPVPAVGKWLLSFYMLVGRLEIFTVLFLFLPSFWKQQRKGR